MRKPSDDRVRLASDEMFPFVEVRIGDEWQMISTIFPVNRKDAVKRIRKAIDSACEDWTKGNSTK